MGVIAASSYSNRILLSPLELADIADLQTLGADASVFRYIPQIQVPFNATAWVQMAISNPENYIRHVVRLRATKAALGYVQINRRRNAELELGYWLGRPHWGQRFGLEASALALALLGSVAGRCRVFAATSPENVASVKILRRLGFAQCNSAASDGMNDHVLH